MLPAVLGSYLFEGNMIASPISVGMLPELAVTVVDAPGTVAYTSTAKAVNDRGNRQGKLFTEKLA